MAVFRVEKTRDYIVLAKFHLKDKSLSLKSKGLLTMMLSLPDEWNYTTRGLATICKEGVESIGTALKELETAGYIVRNRLRDEKGRIYDTEYVIYEQPHKQANADAPTTESPVTVKPDMRKPDADYPYTGNPDMDSPDMVLPSADQPDMDGPCTGKSPQLSNNKAINIKSNNIGLNINQSNQSCNSGCMTVRQATGTGEIENGIDGIDVYSDLIKDNIEYDCLCERYGAERIDEILELMLETVCVKRKYIRIAGSDFPAEMVKKRMLKLNSSHVEYLCSCLDKNTTKIRNIKSYLLTTLYNAPMTIDSYYRAEVQHDLHGTENSF